MKKLFKYLLVFILSLALPTLDAAAYSSARQSGVIYAEDIDSFAAAVGKLFEENYSDDYFSVISIADGGTVADKDGEIIPLGGEARIEDGNLLLPDGVAEKITGGGSVSLFSAFDGGDSGNNEVLTQSDPYLEVTVKNGCANITRPYQTMRLIVKSKNLSETFGAETVIKGANDIYILQYSSEEEARSACELLNGLSGVEYAEPDLYIAPESVSDAVPYEEGWTHNSWGAAIIESDVFCDYLIDTFGGEDYLPEVTAAVVDTGIDYNHAFFKGRISDKGKDLCGSESPQDTQKHGSHVSGIIVDLTPSNVKILPVRVLTASKGGSIAVLAAGIDYAVECKVDVINLSLGAGGTSKTLDNAVKQAYAAGIPCVAAAGNSSIDVSKYSPANVEEAFAISATKANDEFAVTFTNASVGSNFGAGIDFSAPGDRIRSVFLDNSFGYLSGTSQATPHVSAAIALLKSADKSLSVDEVYDILAKSAADLGDAGRDIYYGNGRISLSSAPSLLSAESPLFPEIVKTSELSLEGNVVSVSFQNLSGRKKDFSVIFCAYGEDEDLTQSRVFNPELAGGEQRDITAEFKEAPYAVKMFLWESLDNIKPLAPSQTVLNRQVGA